MNSPPLDEDGDIPPCSIVRSYYAAKCWDQWKLKKHNGNPKATSAVLQFHTNKNAEHKVQEVHE